MELGIALPQYGRYASPDAIVQVAQAAEQLDYAAVWVVERLLRPTRSFEMPGQPPSPLPTYYATVYDPIETLTYVAAKTERIKLGTSIINAPFHVPVVLARRFATLDQLSGGRVIAGLGQGWMEDEFITANVPIKRRGAGFEEFVAALRASWGPDPVHFHGRFYHIPESEIGPKPAQPNGPPVILAVSSPGALERAARIGDGLNPIAFTWEVLEQSVLQFRSLAQAAGRDPAVLPIIVRANTDISAEPRAERQPLSGSLAQIGEDLVRLRVLEIDQVFFDLNMSETPIREQVVLMEQLRALAS